MGQNVQPRGKTIRQAAVLAIWHGRICLITSSNGKHWLVPKGHLEHGEKLSETARQEAWEEAGLIGALRRQPVGSYHYQKCGQTFHVTVFFMEVTAAADEWPEEARRVRRWVPAERALAHIGHNGLRRLLRRVLTGSRPRLAV